MEGCLMPMKVYCRKCRDFEYHDFNRLPFCGRCRQRGHPIIVFLIILVPIAAFIYSVIRLWKGGSW